MAYSITINGIDRTSDVQANTLVTTDNLNDQQDTCTFNLVNRSGNGFPDRESEVIITLADGTRLFGGIILTTEFVPITTYGIPGLTITCTDYVRLLDSNLVHQNYIGMTADQIVKDFVTTYCAGLGITTSNVLSGPAIDQISFNYIQISQAMRTITDLTGYNWYVDYNKDLHFFPIGTNMAPISLSDSGDNYWGLDLTQDNSQLKNRVYVRGSTKLSNMTTNGQKGDGTSTIFLLPDKPHNITITVNGVSKSVGIQNIDLSGFDFYLNYDEKYLVQDSGGAVLGTSDVLSVQYQYDLPILVAVEDTASIAEFGVKEFPIFDNTITTDQAAIDRASAELLDYSTSLYSGTFYTMVTGFKSGQTLNLVSALRSITEVYTVTQVIGTSIGGGVFQYQITLATAKTMGVIRFLTEMLEANQNLIVVSNTEVVDNLQMITDSLLSDSLTDMLTIDSAGAYDTWCPDSVSTTPKTLAKWDLFQWG